MTTVGSKLNLHASIEHALTEVSDALKTYGFAVVARIDRATDPENGLSTVILRACFPRLGMIHHPGSAMTFTVVLKKNAPSDTELWFVRSERRKPVGDSVSSLLERRWMAKTDRRLHSILGLLSETLSHHGE